VTEVPRGRGSQASGKTTSVIDPRFVYLAAVLSVVGASSYIASTLRGATMPNRVTWSLWGVEGILGFGVEIQQHIGLASITTLMLGLMPCVVVLASFTSHHGVWRIATFDVVCGVIALLGIVSWALINEPTVALVSFVAADQVAALPTIRKSWIAPTSESSKVFFLGALNCAITLLTLKQFTTAGALFPGCILVTDLVLGVLIVSRVGPRMRGEPMTTTKAQA